MSEVLRVTFPISRRWLRVADDIFAAVAQAATPHPQTIYHIRMVLSELYSNAYLYGDRSRAENHIVFEACFTSDRFFASIVNDGPGIAENIDSVAGFPPAFAESGRGIKLVQRLCHRVEFKRIDDNRFGVFIEMKLPDPGVAQTVE